MTVMENDQIIFSFCFGFVFSSSNLAFRSWHDEINVLMTLFVIVCLISYCDDFVVIRSVTALIVYSMEINVEVETWMEIGSSQDYGWKPARVCWLRMHCYTEEKYERNDQMNDQFIKRVKQLTKQILWRIIKIRISIAFLVLFFFIIWRFASCCS